MGINVFVPVQHGLTFTVRPHFPALVQQNIEVVGMEQALPESVPMVTRPYVQTLVVPERSVQPSGQRQQWGAVENGVVDGDFGPLHHPRQDFTAHRQAVSAIQVTVQMVFDVLVGLCRLVVDTCEAGIRPKHKPIDFHGNDMEI